MSKVIALDFGHGGKDSGACGNGLNEKNLTLRVGLKIKSRLLDHGFLVKTLRETDEYVGDASERGKKLGLTQADYAISLHCNAGGGKGAEIIVPMREQYGVIERHLQEELETLGQFRKIYSRDYESGEIYLRTINKDTNRFEQTYLYKDYYGILRGAWAYGVSADILELFFIDHQADTENFLSKENQYVEAIVKAICLGFGMMYQSSESTSLETNEEQQPTTESSTTKAQINDKGEILYWRVVVDSFMMKENAEVLKQKLENQGFKSFIVVFEKNGVKYWRVISDSFIKKSNATIQINKLKEAGFKRSFITAEWIKK